MRKFYINGYTIVLGVDICWMIILKLLIACTTLLEKKKEQTHCPQAGKSPANKLV